MRILHDRVTKRFVIHTPEGDGELLYAAREAGVMDFYHVEVDQAIRNRGVAGGIVAAAFDYAREHGQKVVASCPYVRHWLQGHPEARDVLFPM